MDLDQNVCLCFHVSLRKVKNFIRIEKPRRASQLSECFGAGTGCGWCRPYLEKLMADSAASAQVPDKTRELAAGAEFKPVANEVNVDISASDYAEMRQQYVESGKGTPPPGRK